MQKLLIGTDHEVMVNALKDENGNLLDTATVQMTLFEFGTNDPVSGVIWPVVLTNKGSGNYSETLPNSVDLIKNQKFDLEITAEQLGTKRTWRQTVRAVS